MGSFNVSCAVSHLSISSGDECVFIPIRPVKFRIDKHRLGGFICTNSGSCAIYRPATFPIYGKYNDYGQLSDVKENVTTKALKQYNLPYEPMIEVINSQRDLYDMYSGTGHWMDKKIAKFQSSYGSKTNLEKDLPFLGFKKNSDHTYTYPGHDCKVIIIQNKECKDSGSTSFSWPKFNIEFPDKEIQVILTSSHSILEEYYKHTGYLIGFGKNVRKINRLKNLSGCFVRKDVYEFLGAKYLGHGYDGGSWGNSVYITKIVLLKLGFVQGGQDKKTDDRYCNIYTYPGVKDYDIRHDDYNYCQIYDYKKKKILNLSIFHPKMLITEFEKLAKIKFSDSVYSLLDKSVVDVNYDSSKLLQKYDYDQQLNSYFFDDLRVFCLFDQFDRIKKSTFYNVYKKHFNDPEFPKELTKLSNFVDNLFASNRLLYPSVTGHQCGEPKVDNDLAKFVADIANEKYKEHVSDMEEFGV